MCGRFTLRYSPAQLSLAFYTAFVPEFVPRFNIAPTQAILCLVDTGANGPVFTHKRWGLVPSWAKDPAIGNQMINARAETVAEKPAYREALKQHRCLIPADGFYEWQKQGRAKQPYYIRLRSDEPFAFAGLYEQWNHNGQTIDSCTVITTEPNALMAPIHDRMPVILPRAAYAVWLDPHFAVIDHLQTLLRPYPADEMVAYPVSAAVSNALRDDPACIDPIKPKRVAQRELFS